MKDKEEKVVKKKTNNASRSARRKNHNGANRKKPNNNQRTNEVKKNVPKQVVKKEEVKKEVEKKEEKVVKAPKTKSKGINKAPYLFFTVISIFYFAVTICLAGYITYKTVAVIRANSNDNLDSYVSETLITDTIVYDADNTDLYATSHIDNSKVITYYFVVLGTLAVSALLLAIIFSYISEFFSDRRFDNPFLVENIRMIKKCANISVAILFISVASAVVQKLCTPFNVSLLQVESMFIISIVLICSYIVLKRGNEIIEK